MKVNLSKEIVRANGEIVRDGDARPVEILCSQCATKEKQKPPLTVAAAIVTALGLEYRDPDGRLLEHIDGKEKHRRDKLSRRIFDAGTEMVDISIEEAASIKKVIELCYPPYVLGPVYDALECAETPAPAAS